MGRRQANLGTPVPRMPTVAPRPKAHSDLASRRSQRASAERHGTQPLAALIDAWRLTGHGRLRFPTLPRQPPDLTSPWCMQRKPSLPMIVGVACWPSPAINEEGAEPASPISSCSARFFFLASLLAATPMALIRRFSTSEKGKAPRDEPGPLPPKKRLARHRDVVVRPEVSRPWCERPPPGIHYPCMPRLRAPEAEAVTSTVHVAAAVAAPLWHAPSPQEPMPRAPRTNS